VILVDIKLIRILDTKSHRKSTL